MDSTLIASAREACLVVLAFPVVVIGGAVIVLALLYASRLFTRGR